MVCEWHMRQFCYHGRRAETRLTTMAAKDSSRILLLEEEIRSLSEELVQCQADKEFVWSLWKRLQVANPDLTQAVSLIVEREKQKGEAKDRKVLEILQSKDYKIQELEQRVMGQQQEISSLTQRAHSLEQDSEAMMKDMTTLHDKLKEKSKELKEFKEQRKRKEVEQQHAVRDLEEAKAGLDTRCADLQSDLERLLEQAGKWTEEKASFQAKARLEGLTLDTQRVLRTQEAAHSADSVSYQRLYSELNDKYQSLKASEAQLRQSHTSLMTQLCFKDQQILQLQTQLQQAVTTSRSPPVRQSNIPQAEDLPKQRGMLAEFEIPDEPSVNLSQTPSRDTQRHLRRQGTPAQRSRSLSPASGGAGEALARAVKRAGQLEARVQDLEEILRLKTEENGELRKAHDNRRERLRVIETNYKTVREQLKEAEESQGLLRGRNQRAEAWELRQEDSDGVWNELAYFKRLNKNLIIEKTNLEEEVDVLRVQAAVDRVTLEEMRLCLQQEHEELLLKEAEGTAVTGGGSPKTPSVRGLESAGVQVEKLQKRVGSLEKEAELLKQTNQELSETKERLHRRARSLEKEMEILKEVNQELSEGREQLQTSLLRLRSQGAAQQQADRAWHQGVVQEMERELVACRKQLRRARREGTQMRHRLERARQDLGLLRAARDYRSRKHRETTATSPRGLERQQPRPRHTHSRARSRPAQPSTSKDGWEDISVDSESAEEYTDSLNSSPPARAQPVGDELSGGSAITSPLRAQRTGASADTQPQALRPAPPGRVQVPQGWRVGRRRGAVCRALQQRISALQQQVSVLQAAKKAAQGNAQELKLTEDKMAAQLSVLTQRLNSSKQLAQKLTSDLMASEQQRGELEHELEEWKQKTTHIPAPAPAPPNMEAELKGLQAKLKNTCNEVTKHSSANKTLKTELQAKEEQVKELHEKVSHMERDINMKRQLAEDLRNKMKAFQDNDKGHKELIEELEKKVKVLSEEAANRKAFIESLKRRLSVTAKERNEYEESSHKLRKSLDKKDQKLQVLNARVQECEQTMAELEQTASQQMHGLAQQSTQALDQVQRKLAAANAQLEQLHAFFQALVGEIHSDMQEMKGRLRKHRRRQRQPESSMRSKESLLRVQSLAASILNVSHTDLQDILDPEQIPSVSLLMEIVRAKLRERNMLTEELASLKTQASNAT
ncbi:hypothetical protein JZ751_012585 [Albula glossodonta]|uniref:Centlein n=1 Tax=Albula glossodonta TaxID=121402 RepID=A0A8T2NT35_9TELE|nr:hypothetical protein JZ751_012585 [Albula glossodonta]